MNYSIHTYELRKYISYSEYIAYRDFFFTDCEGKYRVYDDGYSVNVCKFADKGVRLKLINTGYIQFVSVIVNPMQVICHNNLTELIKSKQELVIAVTGANYLLTEYLGKDFDIDRLQLCRIDFCVNVRLDSKKQVKSYIKLAYKTGGKKGYRVVGRKNKQINKETGFKAENNQAGTALSIYSKEDQLEDINKPSEDAAKILRIEFQLTKKSTVDKYTYGIKSNREKLCVCFDNSEECIHKILDKTIPHGRYYKFDKAISIVNEHIKNKTKCAMMIDLLKLVSKKHSVECGIKALIKKDKTVSRHYARELLKAFEEIDVNVVTIGRRCAADTLSDLYSFMKNSREK